MKKSHTFDFFAWILNLKFNEYTPTEFKNYYEFGV